MKIFVTVVSGLILLGIASIFGLGYKVNTLEAKVPAIKDSFIVYKNTQEKKDDRIYKELKDMNTKVDALSILVIKLSK